MDITERLRQEHNDIQNMFSELMNSQIEDAESYGKKVIDLMIKLEGHERAEEQTIYAQLQTDLDVRPIALQAMEEHRVARMLMRDLADLEVTEELWLPKLVVANNIVSLHVQIEEGNVLPLIEQMLSDEDRSKLDRDYESAERTMIQQLRS